MVSRARAGTIVQRMERSGNMHVTSMMTCESLHLVTLMLNDESFSGDEILAVFEVARASLALWTEYMLSASFRSQRLGVIRTSWCRHDWNELLFYNMFRVRKEHFEEILRVLQLQGHCFKTEQRCSFSGEEGLLLFLRRLSYPGRWVDVTEHFPCSPRTCANCSC